MLAVFYIKAETEICSPIIRRNIYIQPHQAWQQWLSSISKEPQFFDKSHYLIVHKNTERAVLITYWLFTKVSTKNENKLLGDEHVMVTPIDERSIDFRCKSNLEKKEWAAANSDNTPNSKPYSLWISFDLCWMRATSIR